MTKKPSLYVVERKEVVILVILFILVTILAFTMGVKYGENVGRKSAMEKSAAENALTEPSTNAGGHLGAAAEEPTAGGAEKSPAKEAAKPEAEEAHGEHAEAHTPEKDAGAAHGAKPVVAEGAHGKAPESKPDAKAEAAAPAAVPSVVGKTPGGPDTDEYLLNALKDAGIEHGRGKGGKTAKVSAEHAEEKPQENLDEESARPDAHTPPDEEATPEPLPEKMKGKGHVASKESARDSYWSIQVASYPSETEAKRHSERLRSHNLDPMVFSGLDSGKGKWYRVILGKYSDREKATQVARNYKSKGWIEDGAFVRKIP